MSGKKRGSRATGQTRAAQAKRVRNLHSHSSRNGSAGIEAIPIYVGSKVIGEVRDGVFSKSVRGSVHFLQRPPSIGWDVSALRDAEAAGARSVLVVDRETGREYRAPLGTVWAKGFRVNRGWGDQWALPLGQFNRPAETPAQLPLFTL